MASAKVNRLSEGIRFILVAIKSVIIVQLTYNKKYFKAKKKKKKSSS